jgi:serine/threonine-protein kinase
MLRPKDGRLRVKLLDFGFAKPLDYDSDLTAHGKIAGTLTYIAPEQIQQETLTHHVDIYTLGVVLYEMMTGTPLFKGRTPQETAIMHLRDPAPRIQDRLPSANLPLDELVFAMVQKDPKDRPASMLEVEDALKEIWDDEGLDVFRPAHCGPCEDIENDWHVVRNQASSRE